MAWLPLLSLPGAAYGGRGCAAARVAFARQSLGGELAGRQAGWNRREFLKAGMQAAGAAGIAVNAAPVAAGEKARAGRKVQEPGQKQPAGRTRYEGESLSRVAYPLGGIGAGMICLEGTGALSSVSIRNRPELFNEPCVFAAVAVRGSKPTARVLEGPVPGWKIFGMPNSGLGEGDHAFGLPRFRSASFTARF